MNLDWSFVVRSALPAALSLVSTRAAAQQADAGEYYQRGVQEAKAGHLDAARVEFEAALRLSPHPLVLYNLAKIALEQGHKPKAMSYLRRYLAMDTSSLPSEQVAEVRATLQLLKQQESPAAEPKASAEEQSATGADDSKTAPVEAALPEQPAGPVPSAAQTTATAPPSAKAAPLAKPTATARAASSPEWGGWIFAGTGLGLLLGSAGVWIWNDARHDAAVSERERLERNMPPAPQGYDEVSAALAYARSLGQNDERFAEVRRFDVVAWSLAGVGAACVGTGLWLLWKPQSAAADGVVFMPDGVRLRW